MFVKYLLIELQGSLVILEDGCTKILFKLVLVLPMHYDLVLRLSDFLLLLLLILLLLLLLLILEVWSILEVSWRISCNDVVRIHVLRVVVVLLD
jgi:hypothetical protein